MSRRPLQRAFCRSFAQPPRRGATIPPIVPGPCSAPAHRRVRRVALLALLIGLLGGAAEARAGGLLMPRRAGDRLGADQHLLKLRIEADVRRDVARIRVEQTWRNLRDSTVEVDWLLPLPVGQRPRDPTWFAGDQRRDASFLDGAAARQRWLRLLRARTDSELIEFVGHPLLTAERVALPPRGERRLVMSYEIELTPDERRRDLILPLRASRISAHPAQEVELDVRLHAETAIGPVYSATHDLSVLRVAPGQVVATSIGDDSLLAQDLHLAWTHTVNPVDGMLLTWWPDDELHGYFAFVAASTRVPGGSQPRLPQEVTFLIDASGSMAGERLEGVRRALRQIVSALGPSDRVNIVAYGDAVQAAFEAPVQLIPEQETQALDFLARIRPGGSGDLPLAIRAALAGVQASTRPHHLVLITDSRPTPEPPELDPRGEETAALLATKGVTLWALALGVDLDASYLERLVRRAQGRLWIPAPRETEEEALVELTRSLQEPVLSDVHVDFRNLGTRQVMGPNRALLGAGEQLLWVGRYRQSGRATVELSGREGAIERIFPYELPTRSRGADGGLDHLGRLFALRRAAACIDSLRFDTTEAEASAADDLVDASIESAVVTEVTAFLGSEDDAFEAPAKAAERARAFLANLDKLGQHPAAVALAANQTRRHAAWRVPTEGQRFLVAAERTLTWVPSAGLRWRGGRAFLYRRARGWVESGLEGATPDVVIKRWTTPFFDLLEQASPQECDILAQRRLLTFATAEGVVRVMDAP